MRTLPKTPERLSREIGTLAPQMLEISMKTCQQIIPNHIKAYFYGAEMSNRCIVLDKNMCPDPLEALKPFGELLRCFKMGVSGSGSECRPYPTGRARVRAIYPGTGRAVVISKGLLKYIQGFEVALPRGDTTPVEEGLHMLPLLWGGLGIAFALVHQGAP